MTKTIAPLCLVAFFLFASSGVIGLTMNDDSQYLQASPDIHLSNFLHYKDWGPLYSVWFRVLGIFCPHPIHRFFLSWSILVVLIALIPFWMRIPSSWIYTCLIVVIPCFTIRPYVSLLAAAILLYGLCLLLRRDRSLAWSATAACTVCFVLAFVRPEFTYGVYLSTAAALIALAWEATRSPKTSHGVFGRGRAIAAGVVVTLATMMFLLSLHALRSRSGLAFAQHYAWRAAERGLIPPGPNTWNSDYAVRRFGLDAAHNPNTGMASLGDFFHANPRLFLGHLWHNLEDPRCWGFIVLILAAGLLPFFLSSRRGLRAAGLYLLLLSVPPLLGTVVIYPRAHYMILLFPALTIYALQLTGPARWPQPHVLWVVPLCPLVWVLNHNDVVGRSNEAITDRVSLRQVQCTYAADQSTSADSTSVFSAVPLLPVYLPHRREVVSTTALPTLAAMQDWVEQQRPAWISTNASLLAQYKTSPAELDDLLHGRFGYTAHPCAADAQLTVYEKP